MNIKTIIWDWNGTLLDDLDVSMEALNQLLRNESLPLVLDVEEYKQYFQFPVKIYYEKVGFDFNKTSFEELAKQYMAYYQPHSIACALHKDVIETLQLMKDRKVDQVLLSASDLQFLKQQLAQYSITSYFRDIEGLDNIHAHSKIELAKTYVTNTCLDKQSTLFIGDSVHDSEVAAAAGCLCLLIANGHEHKEKLQRTGYPVVDTMSQAQQWLLQFC